jgi:DNA-binding winged helix-turn-helix (wHTH) protein
VLSFPPFRLDVADERLWRDGKEIPLRRKPFAILRYLAEHPRRLVTREEVVHAVWGKIAMSEGLLRNHVHELRRAIGEGIVETVIGRGYRFVPEVEHIEQVDESTPAGRADSPARFLVGRSDEMGVLRGSFNDVLKGQRRVVFVTGNAGIGKSALAEAFLSELGRERTAWIVRGHCVEHHGAGEAYLPLLDALGAARGVIGPRLIEVLARHAPVWLLQIPSLLPESDVEALQSRAQGSTQTRMLRELAEALEALTREKPIVLLLEDLHWADTSTAELLAMLGQRRGEARLLIIGTYRDTEIVKTHPMARGVSELEAHARATVINLDGLSESSITEYLGLRYAPHALPAGLAGKIHDPSEGNPLFAIELLRDLEHHEALKVLDARWQLTIPLDEVAAYRPDTITRLIDIQIDRLAPSEQRVLEVASAAGAIFTSEVVAAVLDLDPDEVDATCETLANERRLLRAMGTETWPDGTIHYRYGFVHAMYQYAALQRSPSASIRRWHRRIGERLEEGYGTETESISAELAAHFDAGQEFSRAANYYVVAGQRAVNRFGYSSALRQFERAQQLVGHLPAGTDRDEFELRILRNLAPLFLSGPPDSYSQVLPTLIRAIELAKLLGDDVSLGAFLHVLQTCRLRTGAFDEFAKYADEALRVAERLADPTLLLETKITSASASIFAGELIGARDSLDGVLAVIERERPEWKTGTGTPDNPEIIARQSRAVSCTSVGRSPFGPHLVVWIGATPDVVPRRGGFARVCAPRTGASTVSRIGCNSGNGGLGGDDSPPRFGRGASRRPRNAIRMGQDIFHLTPH